MAHTGQTFKQRFEADAAAHDKGLADGSITAIPEVFPVLFGGQPNIGALSAANTIPAFAVKMSDGWQRQFHTREAAAAFIAKHAPKVAA